MTSVIDSSAVVAALIAVGDHGRWCEQVVRQPDLAAPQLMPFEAANIVRRAVAHGDLSAREGTAALEDLGHLDVALLPYDALGPRAWELRANLTTYDAVYVATAELLQSPLVTLDLRLAKAPGPTCEIITPPERD